MKKDTIAAICTGMSNSGIGIIRISGQEALNVANEIFVNKNKDRKLMSYSSHTIHYGFIVDNKNNDEVIDEVMISVMKAPYSYTTEDTVEINCHGGMYLVKKVLELVINNGARLAEPGEFTKRAFLSGRIDLSKAEAVMDVINSSNEMSLKASMKQLRGDLAKKVRSLRDSIIYEIAFIESALDDPEHISLDGYPEQLNDKVTSITKELELLLNNANKGKIIKDGINTVIVGKPNAGKSSLLNILAGEERAIVTDIAGTTRDIIEEHINLNGLTLNMIDTAGIHDTDDKIEQIGVEKAADYALDADLILYVVDSSVPLDEDDVKIMDLIKNKKTIVLLNKSDLDVRVNEETLKKYNHDYLKVIKTSTKENEGIDELENCVKELFLSGEIEKQDEILIMNLRHKELIQNAYESMKLVKRSIEDGMPEDFFSIDLMNAYSSLGFIIGEEVEDDLVNEIFSKFCTGK